MFLSDKQYAHAMELYTKRKQPSPLLTELAAWAYTAYDITVIDYICEQNDRQGLILRLVLWNLAERMRIFDQTHNYDPQIQRAVLAKFRELSEKYHLHPEYLHAEKVFVGYETLQDQMMQEIIRRAGNKLRALTHRDISKTLLQYLSLHIFYETDLKITENAANGISASIETKCQKILQKYDTHRVWQNHKVCQFSSMETLNRDYKGNLFYYMQDH